VVDARSVARGGAKVVGWITGRSEDELLFQRPYGVTWDGEALLVADPALGRVLRIDERGRLTTSPDGEFDSPIGVATCPLGIVVTDSVAGTVTLLDERLRPRGLLAEELERPTGVICRGPNILVVETGRHRVIVLKPGGPESGESVDGNVPLVSWGRRGAGGGEFNFPTAITASDGSIWIGDTLNFRVQEFDRDNGEYRRSFGELGDAPGELPRIKGMAVDATSNFWISDAHLDRVALFDREGAFLTSLGGHGIDPGQFSFPAGIAAHDDGRVAVVDSLNRRVQIFRVAPADTPED